MPTEEQLARLQRRMEQLDRFEAGEARPDLDAPEAFKQYMANKDASGPYPDDLGF